MSLGDAIIAGTALVYDLTVVTRNIDDLGQYILYRTLLKQLHPDYRLYLAIEKEAYETFFQTKGIQLVIEEYQILLIVINIVQEEIVQWIN